MKIVLALLCSLALVGAHVKLEKNAQYVANAVRNLAEIFEFLNQLYF